MRVDYIAYLSQDLFKGEHENGLATVSMYYSDELVEFATQILDYKKSLEKGSNNKKHKIEESDAPSKNEDLPICPVLALADEPKEENI